MASSDEAAQSRIINHMNQDHKDSLVRYLESHHSLSSQSARNARLVSVSHSFLRISINSSNDGAFVIPIDPPLNSWSDARTRLAEMDHEALRSLGRSQITAKEYRWPRGVHAFMMLLCGVTFIAFSRRNNFAPKSTTPVLGQLAAKYPDTFAWLYKIQPTVLYPMIAIHAAEALWMDRSRMQKHSVPRLSALWWKWILSNFVEGLTVFQRFDAMIAEQEAKRAQQKH